MEAQETPVRRQRAPGGIWGILTAIVGVLTLSLCGWYGLIMINPYSPLNPLPPATVTPYPGLVATQPTGLGGQPTEPTGAEATPSPNPTAPVSAVATLTPNPVLPATATVGAGAPTATTSAGATATAPVGETATLEPTASGGGDGYPTGGETQVVVTPVEGYPP